MEISQLMNWVVVTAVVVCLVILLVYTIFGKGLAFRIYALLMPLIGFVGLMGMAAGRLEFTFVNVVIICVPTLTIILFILYYLYRFTITALRKNVAELQSSSAQLSATASQSASTAAEQAGVISQMSTTMEEIARTAKAGSDSAQEVVKVSSEAVEKGVQGQQAIQQALSIMARIGQVNRIVDNVNQLAEQSNLLAVNAGIEAAKAGEYGRGFAVVASEVRSLAEQSRRATVEIRDALMMTDEGRQSIEATRGVVDDLVKVLEEASDRSRQIAGTAVQQATGIRQINEAAVSLSQTSQDNAIAAKQIEDAVGTLEAVAVRLKQFVGGRQAVV